MPLKRIDDFFPKAESKPISGNDVLEKYKETKFLGWRNRGGYEKDYIRPKGSVAPTITRKGIDIYGRKLINDSDDIKVFASFPNDFVFSGNNNEHVMRIGNAVPPLFMRSIARQIKYALFNGENPNVTLKKIDYIPFLESCWNEHLQPKPDNAPTVISTFAGCGGSSLGYSMAGFRELLAVEWDNNAVETFKLNFPDVPVYHGDIAKISVEDILKMTGLKVGELDIFDGSPPCQGFSTAGKRQLDDPRNQLFREYVRLLRGLKPKVFVMENVSGMVKGVMKIVFVEILKELKASGYKVSARLLNAMYFNVPQSRQRMIFIGVRDDLAIEPSHPEAENVPVTMGEACQVNTLLLGSHGAYKGNIFSGNEASPTLCKTGYPSYIHEALFINDAELKETEIKETWQMYRVLTGKENKKHFGLIKLDANKPASTIQKDAGNTTTGVIHPYEIRKMSIPEIKRIASFPDLYNMVGDYKEKWARIGNSVPPLFMRSIARHIRQAIL